MALIATEATNVGEVVQSCADMLLNGSYAESAVMDRKIDKERNGAARVALQQLVDLLNNVYCADRDTLLKDIPTPTL